MATRSAQTPKVHVVAGVEVTVENWSDDYVRQWVLCHKGRPVRDQSFVITATTRRRLIERLSSKTVIAAVQLLADHLKKEVEAYMQDLADATGSSVASLIEAGYDQSVPEYLANGKSVKQVASVILSSRRRAVIAEIRSNGTPCDA